MTGKGGISVEPNRKLRVMLGAHLVWLGMVCVLGAWWGRVIFRQSARIEELEQRLGLAAVQIETERLRIERMLSWESATFFALLIAVTGVVLWLYWSEARRARGLQAFFASVTHELRTPLTSIRLQAESIADQLKDAGTRPLVERLLEDTSRLESQVERTLELARVEGGGSVLTQSLRLKPWLEHFLRNWDEGHATKLEVASDLRDCLVQADPSAVQVILKNLLENSQRHAQGRRVHLECAPEGDWVRLRYWDDGEPFEGDVRQIGKLFHKGAQSSGAGVGLYLVSALMNRMGGRVEFEARPQLTTSLWFRAGESHG